MSEEALDAGKGITEKHEGRVKQKRKRKDKARSQNERNAEPTMVTQNPVGFSIRFPRFSVGLLLGIIIGMVIMLSLIIHIGLDQMGLTWMDLLKEVDTGEGAFHGPRTWPGP